MFEPLPKRDTLVETVVSKLNERLSAGEPPADTRLPAESALATQLGVSRTVIREAVARLKADGLVYNLPGKGLFAANRDGGEGVIRFQRPDLDPVEIVARLLEMRSGLEVESARYAAMRVTPNSLDRIKRAFNAIEQAVEENRDGVDEDMNFHIEIARASRNPFILQVLEFLSTSIRGAIRKSREIDAERTDNLADVHAEHAGVLEAIERGDGDAAAAAMRRHTESGQKRLLAEIQSSADETSSDIAP